MNGHKTTQHGGAWQGFTCFILRYPDDNLSVAVLTNLAGGGPGMIAKVVAGMINPALMPPKLTAIPDDQPALAESLKKLLAQIGRRRGCPQPAFDRACRGPSLPTKSKICSLS